jgi:hypothetical protein
MCFEDITQYVESMVEQKGSMEEQMETLEEFEEK